MAELDIRTAALQAQTMARYVDGFTRDMIQGFSEKNAREFLGKTLDHLQETAAMLGNLADRLAAPAAAIDARGQAGWSDDQMIRFGNYIRSNSADSHEQRLELFREHEAMRGIPAPALASRSEVPTAFQQALDIRIAQGWQLGGNACPVLYTDTINGEQVCRDDLWLATTAGLKGAQPESPAVRPNAAGQEQGWISVANRLPAHEQTVLCHGIGTKERWTSIACFHQDGSFYDPEIGDELFPPSHWMPLPHPPLEAVGSSGMTAGQAQGDKT